MIRDDRLVVGTVVLLVAVSALGLATATATTDEHATTATAAAALTPTTAGQASVADGRAPVTDERTSVADSQGSVTDRRASATDPSPTECVNGTSPAVLACGYQSGPTAVEVDPQTTTGRSVTVRAVDLDRGGFVAVHRIAYVDGAFVESVVGVSEYLSPGLHENVAVDLDERLAENATLVAVVYRDTDADRTFDFADTHGEDDGPYTITYSERGGHVTDEAGDVVGDTATVTVASGVPGYAGRDGVVDDEEFVRAVEDWAAGEISTDLLRAVMRAWARGAAGQ